MQTSNSTIPATSPTNAESTASNPLAIAGVNEPIILQYFETINAGNFQVTSQLFAAEGALQPPFEELIVGPEAIAAYLDKEAKGFTLQPQQGTANSLEDGSTEYEIGGKVQTPWFSVNVAWLFVLSPDQQILLVNVKLLASLKELVHLRR